MTDLGHVAFGRSPVKATDGENTYVFPYVSAAEWLDRLTDRERGVVRVLQLMDQESYEIFLDRLLGMDKDHNRFVIKVARSAMAAASGRPWWEAERLAQLACGDVILGMVLSTGADPDRMSLAAFCALVWTVTAKNLDENKRLQLEAEVTMPPPEAVEQNDVPEMDLSSTVAMLRNLPGVRTG